MSVIIKGMRLPNNCLACDFLNPFIEKPYCRRLMKISPTTGRLEDCPLAKVPTPHGRLIDEQAVRDIIDSGLAVMTKLGVAVDADCLWGAINNALETAPTVIEAEEGER